MKSIINHLPKCVWRNSTPAAAILLTLTSCASPGFVAPKAIVDLSPAISEDTPIRSLGEKLFQQFPGMRATTTFKHAVIRTPFYAARSYLELDNHNGAHFDPPNHVIEGGKSVDQVSLDRFVGRAVVLDFRDKPKDQPLTRADFKNRGIRRQDIVIVCVGYRPPPPNELPSYAYLSGEAAEYLATLPIKAFVSDMPSLGGIRNFARLTADGVQGSRNFLSEHYAFLSREIPNIEGLVNLEVLVNQPHVVFVGFPLKIKDGNGAPLRAVAFVY